MSSTSIKRYQTASPTGSYRINSYKHIQIYIKLHKYTNTYKYHQIPRAINPGPMHSHEEFFVATLAGHSCSLAGACYGLLLHAVAMYGNVANCSQWWQCLIQDPCIPMKRFFATLAGPSCSLARVCCCILWQCGEVQPMVPVSMTWNGLIWFRRARTVPSFDRPILS